MSGQGYSHELGRNSEPLLLFQRLQRLRGPQPSARMRRLQLDDDDR